MGLMQGGVLVSVSLVHPLAAGGCSGDDELLGQFGQRSYAQ